MSLSSRPLDVLLLILAVVVFPALSAAAGRTYARTPRSALRLERRYWYIVVRGALGSALVLLAWRRAGRPYSGLGLDVPAGVGGRVGFALDAMLAGYYVYALLVRELSPERAASARRRLDSYRIVPRTRGEFALFPFVGIAGSVFEELLYRGFLIGVLTPLASVWGAVLLSSVIFGLAHAYQGPIGMLRTTLIGLAFATGYALTHSLWWLMVAHVTVSLAADLFARRLVRLAPAPAR